MITLKQKFIEEFGEELGTILYNKARPHFYNWLQQKQKFYSKGSASLRSKNAMFNELLEELK